MALKPKILSMSSNQMLKISFLTIVQVVSVDVGSNPTPSIAFNMLGVTWLGSIVAAIINSLDNVISDTAKL